MTAINKRFIDELLRCDQWITMYIPIPILHLLFAKCNVKTRFALRVTCRMFYAISVKFTSQVIPASESIEDYLNDHFRLRLPIGRLRYVGYHYYHGRKYPETYPIAIYLHVTRTKINLQAFTKWIDDEKFPEEDFPDETPARQRELSCVSYLTKCLNLQ